MRISFDKFVAILTLPIFDHCRHTLFQMFFCVFYIYIYFSLEDRPRGNKTFSILNSAEHKIYPTHK